MARRPAHLEPPRKVLSAAQQEAVTAILAGETVAEVARKAGVSRQAVSQWKRDPVFAAELARRSEVKADAADRAMAGAVEREARAYRHARTATWSAIAHVSDVIRAKALAAKSDPERSSIRPGDLESLVRSAAILRELEPAVTGDESDGPIVLSRDSEAARKVHELLLAVADPGSVVQPMLDVEARAVDGPHG